MPNVVQATKTQPSSYSFAKIFYPITNRNRNLFLPAQIRPSPVEMEHVSTTPVVTATTGILGPVRFNGYGRWETILSENRQFPVEF